VNDPGVSSPRKWSSVWIDALAFAGGLALAWFGEWQTKDLVWSLWLSSLLVGYAMIVWMIFSPELGIALQAWTDRSTLPSPRAGLLAVGASANFIGGLFLLAFFTVHFGMFHFGHSVFLSLFFPVLPGRNHGPSLMLYGQVLAAYWPFVLVAAVAERQAFRWPGSAEPPDTSVKAADIAARKARKAKTGFGGGDMMIPYKNVIRLHLLIFFFAGAHFVKLDSFLVYAVVYAVYFFPWRLLKKQEATSAEP
jgi:hypothetical protein